MRRFIHLSPGERDPFIASIRQRITWLERVHLRMDDRGWDTTCPVYVAIVDAKRAMLAVMTAILAKDEPGA